MALNLALSAFRRLEESAVIQRVSTTSAGNQVNDSAHNASVSANGRYVLFESFSGGFVDGDTNGQSDVFLKDLLTGSLTLVSRASDGSLGVDASYNAQFSPDGQFVTFESRSGNFVPGDVIGAQDIFRKNLSTGVVTRLTTAFDGVEANHGSGELSLTSNGRYAVFTSYASNLTLNDTNDSNDIFLRDLATGAITRVSVGRDGIQGNGSSGQASVSADGRYVVFRSISTNLVGGDTNGVADIFYKDLITDAIVRLSISNGGQQANNDCRNPKFSADGRYVIFESDASNLVDGDTNGKVDIFRKDLLAGELVRVSTKSDGSQVGDNSSDASISADGRYILFRSNGHDIVEADSFYDGAFRKDMLTGKVVRISDAGASEVNGHSAGARFSPDGRYITFETNGRDVLPNDANGTKSDIIWVDADRIADSAAIREGRFIELNFDASTTSTVTLAWGDGAVDVVHPASGRASFSHAFATTGTKSVVATVQEGGQSRSIAYIIDLAAGTMVKNSAAPDTIAGGAGADRIIGDGAANHLFGHGGNDVLDGQAGVDRMAGGAGDDVYMVDNASDQVVEAGFEGTDLVYSSVNHSLAAQVENVTATGFSALTLYGNDLRNVLIGNIGSNTLAGNAGDDLLSGGASSDALVGGAGNDVLEGGADNDVLDGGAGNDMFLFDTAPHKSTNKDRILNWNYREDTIRLDNDIFKKLTKPGVLQAKYFTLGNKAKDANDFIGVTKSGDVWYDANGNKAGGQVVFANIGKKPAFASDFLVF